MRKALFTAIVSISLLGACRQSADDQSSNRVADNAAAQSETAGKASTNASAPVSREQAQQIFRERHEGMESIGKATKAITQELKSNSPDVAVIRSSAARINELARKSSGWFPAGTGKDVIEKTRAKPEIWQKPDDFAAKDRGLQQAAQAFNAAAQSGDMNAIKARFDTLGKTCKACHDSYRAPEHDK